MADKITDIKGIDAEAAEKLSQAGIKNTDQLVEHGMTSSQRNALAKQIGVSGSQLTEWVNRADLMRLKGVGKEMANLLEECGVDSVKELQHRRPENLQTMLKQKNDEMHIAHHAPTLNQVQAWIDEAKSMSAVTS